MDSPREPLRPAAERPGDAVESEGTGISDVDADLAESIELEPDPEPGERADAFDPVALLEARDLAAPAAVTEPVLGRSLRPLGTPHRPGQLVELDRGPIRDDLLPRGRNRRATGASWQTPRWRSARFPTAPPRPPAPHAAPPNPAAPRAHPWAPGARSYAGARTEDGPGANRCASFRWCRASGSVVSVVEDVEREDAPREHALVLPSTSPSAFAGLYHEQFRPMVRLAYLLVGSTDDARDIVQDAFVGLHRRFDRVDEPVAYLRRSVVNGCRSHHRRLARRRSAVIARGDDRVELGARELLDALAALPHRQRAALVLRYDHDLSDAEIAALLGCRPGTVASLAHRGLARLREVITP